MRQQRIDCFSSSPLARPRAGFLFSTITEVAMTEEYGQLDGERCGRLGCNGVIKEHQVENCSCHISPPCGACTTPREYCPVCGWEAADDEVFNDFVVNVNRETGVYRTWTPRPLDTSKIDWHSKPHTNASMIKEGCYPPGTTAEEVRKLVDGTFGGAFVHFGNGRFKFIAYTD
ncbi:hypothetical protein [Chromobacterium violaceum]|uniref:hypothetical protein n=1 Tax=Chromobacterium violaceum TaxID=536 RepID=UPI00143D4CAC|nr:hypothetical protein [Chromobacterium violaceum]QIY81478.1 hypothetical protein FOB43_20920 [Chromobacterium violaceum]